MTRPSVYEFAGGMPAFLALATAHHARCLADPVLEHPFSQHATPDHVQRLAGYWAEVFGGPHTYTPGHSGMLAIHRLQGMEGDLGERFVRAFDGAADDVALPDDPEFRRVLHEYMVAAVADTMVPEPAPEGLPMPRWGWDGPLS